MVWRVRVLSARLFLALSLPTGELTKDLPTSFRTWTKAAWLSTNLPREFVQIVLAG